MTDVPYVYVLDTETTGLCGAPNDVVVDIGIVRLDLLAHSIEPVYSSVVGYNTLMWTPEQRNAWVFSHTDLTEEDVLGATDLETVADDVRRLLRDRYVTSYNTDFDFARFLDYEPWSLGEICWQVTDPMLAAAAYFKIPSEYPGRYKWPRLDWCYDALRGDSDPCNLHGQQKHRAQSDAEVAAYVMSELYDRGGYQPEVVA